jgi:hypothetical protein
MTSAIELARIYECEQTSRIGEVSRALIASEARVARLEADEKRMDWILDHCTTLGNGKGFMLSVYIPQDSECVRSAIDSMIAGSADGGRGK